MRRRRHLSAEELRRTLREWDPTHEDARLTREESREIERILAVPPSPKNPFSTRRRWPQFALATGGGLLVVLALLVAGVWFATERTSLRDPLRPDQGAAARQASPDGDGVSGHTPVQDRAVQVQLIARGGTRIVWVLNPELPSLPDNLEDNSDAK